MTSILWILCLFNTAAVIYLIFLISRKYRNNTPKSDSIATLGSGIEKIKLTRFNPFDDVGGDQSFILVLLDKSNSGILLTSLHHRSFTRIYAKPIKDAQGDNITLSKEEKSAILKAINH